MPPTRETEHFPLQRKRESDDNAKASFDHSRRRPTDAYSHMHPSKSAKQAEKGMDPMKGAK